MDVVIKASKTYRSVGVLFDELGEGDEKQLTDKLEKIIGDMCLEKAREKFGVHFKTKSFDMQLYRHDSGLIFITGVLTIEETKKVKKH